MRLIICLIHNFLQMSDGSYTHIRLLFLKTFSIRDSCVHCIFKTFTIDWDCPISSSQSWWYSLPSLLYLIWFHYGHKDSILLQACIVIQKMIANEVIFNLSCMEHQIGYLSSNKDARAFTFLWSDNTEVLTEPYIQPIVVKTCNIYQKVCS